jgi:hypothetical protein
MKRSILAVGSVLALALVAAPAVASFVPPPGQGGQKPKETPKKEQPKKEDPKKEEPKKPS